MDAEDSPIAIESSARITTLRASSLNAPAFRLDSKHYQEEFVLARNRVLGCGYKSIPVKSIAHCFVPGRMKLVTVRDSSAGAPYLRAHDVFEVRPRGERFVSRVRTQDYDAYLLREGMILTPSSGRNLGPLAYVGKSLSNYAMTDILRIVPEEEGFYLLAYLMTPTGQALIRRGRTGTTVDHLSPDDVADIPVVWLDDATRMSFAAKFRQAEKKIDTARINFNRAEEELHDLSGLKLPIQKPKYLYGNGIRAFSMTSDQLSLRIDAAYYDPLVSHCQKTLKRCGGMKMEQAADLRMLGRYKRYYVSKERGRPILSGRQLLQFRPVNLQFISDRSFTDPISFVLQKKWTIFTCDGRAEEALASPAYVHSRWQKWLASNHVMRAIPKAGIPPGYLYAALRSPYVQLQLKSRATGSVVDALDPETINDVLIPVLDSHEMKRIGGVVENAWESIATALQIEDTVVSMFESCIVSGYERGLTKPS
jgi:hypothetical protein